MSNNIITDQFVDNLPDSLTWDNQVQTVGMVSDQQATGLQAILPNLLVLCNIPNLPEPVLDLLAFQYQVLFYSATFNITDPDQRLAAKRSLLANNFYYHAHLGTPATVQDIITQLSAQYGPVLLQEWWLYGGSANHFRILLPQTVDPSVEAQIGQYVNVVKRASQAMEGFFLYSTAPMEFYVAVGVFTQIWLTLPIPSRLPATINYITAGISVFALPTVQRSSAIVNIHTTGVVIASARQWVLGAPIVDIHAKISVSAVMRTLTSVLVKIQAGTQIVD